MKRASFNSNATRSRGNTQFRSQRSEIDIRLLNALFKVVRDLWDLFHEKLAPTLGRSLQADFGYLLAKLRAQVLDLSDVNRDFRFVSHLRYVNTSKADIRRPSKPRRNPRHRQSLLPAVPAFRRLYSGLNRAAQSDPRFRNTAAAMLPDQPASNN